MDALRYSLKIIFILNIFGIFYCNAREVKIPFDGKHLDFNVSVYQGKVFNDVPLWTIHSAPSENHEYTYNGIAKLNGTKYEDPTKKAILFEKSDCCEDCWEGVFGFGTKIISNSTKTQTLRLQSLHKGKGSIYVSDPVSEFAKTKLNRSEIIVRTSDLIANIVYPKLLVVVDRSLYKKLGSNMEYTIKYLDIFWTAVALQYKNGSTDIDLRITGLIIATIRLDSYVFALFEY